MNSFPNFNVKNLIQKFEYKDNPLENKIHLSWVGIHTFKFLFVVYELSKKIIITKSYLSKNIDDKELQYLKKDLDIDDFFNFTEYEPLMAVEDYFQQLHGQKILDSLQGSHNGDCVKQPSSCLKCHAEELLGIDSLLSDDRYVTYFINSAFTKTQCLSDAINNLKSIKNNWHRKELDHTIYLLGLYKQTLKKKNSL